MVPTMADEGNTKLTGIRQIIRLKEMLQKWQAITLGPKNNNGTQDEATIGGIPPAINKRLKNTYISCDSDEESCQSPEPPPDVPKGYLAVYVGPELRRFIIPTSYLSHRVFKVLLEKTEEEFGFDHKGALTIPCETETFKYLINLLRSNPNADDLPDEDAEENEENIGETAEEKGEEVHECSNE
ncbi:Auxin-responsive protein [Thalictrum thalictroides]|uniref:Auxin-responsive protein n=1 Tax=Thalictrum thalictroides TaxID=46969 RepID=A0A7J6VVC3_THATH|nr:Auxin-responsive protein [Thalictrum thalictroides]